MEVLGGHSAAEESYQRPGLDIWMYREAAAVPESGGGDLHLISSCASGRITRVLLADVCGLGSMFSQVSFRLRDLVKRNVNTIRQQRIVKQMSEMLEIAAQHGSFASTVLATYFSPTRSITVCNTGHPSPLIFRQATGAWEILKAEAIEHDSDSAELVQPDEYQHFTSKLSVGDLFLCYSNVLTECCDASGRTLGQAGVRRIVEGLDSTSPEELLAQLRKEVGGLHDENTQVKDATMVLFRGTDAAVGWKENVLAPLRLLRGAVSDKTVFGGPST